MRVYPMKAAGAYLKHAQNLIARRGRDNYREACQWLKKAREIHSSQDSTAEWEALIKKLRENNKTLRALQDELNKAHL